jgi:hypothetical protein
MKSIYFSTLLIFLFLFSDPIVQAQQINTSRDSTESSLEIGISAGVGLVRNTLAPEFDLTTYFDVKKRMQFGMTLSSFYFFEKHEDVWRMYDHYLLGAEFMFSTFFLNLFPEKDAKRSGFGLAYLIGRKGDFFTGTTMKFYLVQERGLRVRPELWMTNDFRTFFPGLALVF